MLTNPTRRSEAMRWHVLTIIDTTRPSNVGATDAMCLDVLRSVYPDATLGEVREELQYLHKRELLELGDVGLGRPWRAVLTRHGMDVVDYTVAMEPGIARPLRD